VTRRLLPVLVASCAALCACGGGGGGGGGSGGGGGGSGGGGGASGGGSHATGPSTHAAAVSGRALFSQACGACHTLTGHNDPRHQGGDLRGFHASRAQFLQLAAEMPVRHPLNSAQLQSVVGFVMSVEARH
jgi:hypothetical protein